MYYSSCTPHNQTLAHTGGKWQVGPPITKIGRIGEFDLYDSENIPEGTLIRIEAVSLLFSGWIFVYIIAVGDSAMCCVWLFFGGAVVAAASRPQPFRHLPHNVLSIMHTQWRCNCHCHGWLKNYCFKFVRHKIGNAMPGALSFIFIDVTWRTMGQFRFVDARRCSSMTLMMMGADCLFTFQHAPNTCVLFWQQQLNSGAQKQSTHTYNCMKIINEYAPIFHGCRQMENWRENKYLKTTYNFANDLANSHAPTNFFFFFCSAIIIQCVIIQFTALFNTNWCP